MPYSEIFAEPVGALAGVIAGEIGREIALQYADSLGLSEDQAVFLGTATGHFLSNLAATGITNLAMGDVISATAINPFTSAAGALAHAGARVATRSSLQQLKQGCIAGWLLPEQPCNPGTDAR